MLIVRSSVNIFFYSFELAYSDNTCSTVGFAAPSPVIALLFSFFGGLPENHGLSTSAVAQPVFPPQLQSARWYGLSYC